MSLETISHQYRLTKVKAKSGKKKDSVENSAELSSLSDVSPPALAAHLEERAGKQMVYTSAGPVLLSMNPMEEVPAYGEEVMKLYAEEKVQGSERPPHVYGLAERVYRNVISTGENQMVVINGLSGSGKTYNARQVTDYLAAQMGAGESPVAELLSHADVVLDSFGHALTGDNASSSRFGRFTRVLFPHKVEDEVRADPAKRPLPTSAALETLQLDVDRVTRVEQGERNFNIFYQLLRGYKHLPAGDAAELKLEARFVEQFDILNQSDCFNAPGREDEQDFGRLLQALSAFGMTRKRQLALFRVVAGVLHLGNVSFFVKDGGRRTDLEVEASSKSAVEHAAFCFGVDKKALGQLLLGRQVNSGTKQLFKPFKLEEAEDNRDNLANTLYERLFADVVARLNDRLAFKPEKEEESKEETVKVAVRCRPLLKHENGHATVVQPDVDNNRAFIYNPGTWAPKPPAKVFTFDHVYPPTARQATVFDEMARPIIDATMRGYNGTIFAYGQTGTGKTFTMEGNPKVKELRGMIPRAFEYIWERIAAAPKNVTYKVKVTMLEVYNNEVFDLLDPNDKRTKRTVKEDTKKKMFFVDNLSTQTVKSASDMAKWLELGQASRRVGATKMNEGSSRSHSMFSVTVKRVEVDPTGTKRSKTGKLNMVDLAGSERQKKSKAAGDRLEEAKNINLSLSALGNVIKALVDPKIKHVPFRDSVLTRLLADSLGGNTKTVMIANIGPSHTNFDETMNTLRYADRAKEIKNQPTLNEVSSGAAAAAAGGQPWLGVLDPYGFERYEDRNGFHQLMCNYAAERVQKFFNRTMIDSEQTEYMKEAIDWVPVDVPDCQAVISLVHGKSMGLFSLLENTAKEKGDAESFLRSTLKIHKKNPFVKRVTDLERPDGDVGQGFLVRHFGGGVRYDGTGFLRLNSRKVRPDVANLFSQSEFQASRKLLGGSGFKMSKTGTLKKQKQPESRAVAFKKAVTEVMDSLKDERTVSHFVVCLTPNQFRQAGMFDSDLVQRQVQALGVAGYCQIARHGYHSHVSYQDIHGRFGHLLPWVKNQRDFTEAVFIGFGVESTGYKLGLTRVFLRPGQQEVLEKVLSSKNNLDKKVVARIRSFLIRRRWARARAGVLLLVRLDMWVRRHKALLKFAHAATAAFCITRAFSSRMSRLRKVRAVTALQSAVHAFYARAHLESKKRSLRRLQGAWRKAFRARSLERSLETRARQRRQEAERQRRQEEERALAAMDAARAEEERKRLEAEAAAREKEEAERLEREDARKREELERRRREAEELREAEEAEVEAERLRKREMREAAKALRAEEAAGEPEGAEGAEGKGPGDADDDADAAAEEEEERKGPLDPEVVAALMRAQEEERRLRQQEAAQHKAARLRHVLLTGGKFLKYGRKGNPHIKWVCMNALGNLHWSNDVMDPRKLLPSSSFIKLKDVVKVVKGKGTAVLNRKVAKRASEMLCFSVITHQRSLDLQATTVRERDTWVAAICSAMKDLSQGVICMIKGTAPSHTTFGARRQAATLRRSNTIQVSASKNVRPSVNRLQPSVLGDKSSKLEFLKTNGQQEFLLFQMVGKPRIIYVEVVSGTIYWSSKPNPSTKPDSESASMAEVQSVKEGKQTGMFSYRSIDALSPVENCMSLIFKTWTMDLQVSSNELRNRWVEAFKAAVEAAKDSRAKRRAEAAANAGSSAAGDGYGTLRGAAAAAGGSGTMARMKLRRAQSQTLPMGRAGGRPTKISAVKWVPEEKDD